MTIRQLIDDLNLMIEESPNMAEMPACYASSREDYEACEIDSADFIGVCRVQKYDDGEFSYVDTACVRFL